MKYLSFLLIVLSLASCTRTSTRNPIQGSRKKIIAKHFAFPIGKTEYITEAKDSRDKWYNAQDFGENNHLGEDWNINSGGNTDCGKPVYASANGIITYAKDAGTGWGNVIIITHTLPDGKRVQTIY